MFIRKIFLMVDGRREKIEDFIADKILKTIDENTKIDELQEKAVLIAFEAADTYLVTNGIPTLPENVKNAIARGVVRALGKANRKIQNRLRKKKND